MNKAVSLGDKRAKVDHFVVFFGALQQITVDMSKRGSTMTLVQCSKSCKMI
jgi:hypothetical protein